MESLPLVNAAMIMLLALRAPHQAKTMAMEIPAAAASTPTMVLTLI